MPATVFLPRALQPLFPTCPLELTVDAKTVSELMHTLDASWPGMHDRLCDSTPRIRPHINVFVNGQMATLTTPIPDGSEVVILTAISGG